MTNEEAITYLEWMKDLAEDLETPEQKNTMLEVINKAIKALEQEPVLDKIRAEIEEIRQRAKTYTIDPCDLVGDCLDIIDKYKAESEVE